MSNLEKVEQIAERLRQEPYSLLTNNCFFKAIKLRRACELMGIPVKIVACIGLAKARLFGFWMMIPVIHGWAVVEGKRIETSRPIGSSGMWDIVSANIRPVLALRF